MSSFTLKWWKNEKKKHNMGKTAQFHSYLYYPISFIHKPPIKKKKTRTPAQSFLFTIKWMFKLKSVKKHNFKSKQILNHTPFKRLSAKRNRIPFKQAMCHYNTPAISIRKTQFKPFSVINKNSKFCFGSENMLTSLSWRNHNKKKG